MLTRFQENERRYPETSSQYHVTWYQHDFSSNREQFWSNPAMIAREILHVCSNQNALLVYSTDISVNASANWRESEPCLHQTKLEIRAKQRKSSENPKDKAYKYYSISQYMISAWLFIKSRTILIKPSDDCTRNIACLLKSKRSIGILYRHIRQRECC